MGFEAFAGARSIAVVGASERNLIARITIDNLKRWGYPGRMICVHPSGRPVEGVPTVPAMEEPVDLCLMAVGVRNLVGAVQAAIEAGAGTVVIPGAGANEGGREIEADLRAAVQDGVEAIGPNCMGFASLHERVVPYVGTLDPDLQPGSVAIVSQSGSVCELFTALPWRVGFSHVISVGNELGLDLTGALEYLVDDPRTRTIGLFIEGIRRPDAFRHALLRAADAGKPVVSLKVGRSDLARSGTVAHTGALAGDARVFSAVLRDAGAIEVADLDEMLVTLELLGKGLRRRPDKIVYAGDSGGEANLFADVAATRGVDLPALGPDAEETLRTRFPTIGDAANPLDLWALGRPEETYADGVKLLVERQPHLVILGLDKFLARTEPERAFVRAGVSAVPEPGAVILMALAGSDCGDEAILETCWKKGVPVVRGADRTLAALAGIARWEGWRDEQHIDRRPAVPHEAVNLAAETSEWTEHNAKRLLHAAGIPVTREEEVETVDRAVKAAVEIGFPIVAKIAGGGIAHKTEAGGVRLNLMTPEAVASAAEELLALAPRVLVAEQRSADLELIVSAFVDEQFGPCGLIGLGGLWTEALQESVVIAGPGSRVTVRRALQSNRWGPFLLRGARGRRFASELVIDVALRLIDLVEACRERIHTIEINPLFVKSESVVAVDALVVPAEARHGDAHPPTGNSRNAS